MTRRSIARILPEPIKRPLRVLRARVQNATSRVNDHAIYILGHPRSGTTAIARLLGMYTGLDVGIERGWSTRHVEALYSGQQSLDSFMSSYRYPFSKPIVQTPGLTPILPMLKDKFPYLTIVYIVRDPRDVLCSVVKQSNHHEIESFEIRNPTFRIFQNSWLGIDEPDPVRSVAKRWCAYLDTASGIPGVQFYRYEDFCADKATFIADLSSDLALPERGESIADSLNIQYRDKGSIRGTGRWKTLLPPEAVRDIELICEGSMRRFGYEITSLEQEQAKDSSDG